MTSSNNLESRVRSRIVRRKSAVFLREDFEDLGGYDQVGRILRKLTTTGYLIRIGYGLYAKTRFSTIAGELVPTASLPSLAKEALGRLGVVTSPSTIDIAYQEGKSPQVPTGRLIGVRKRVSRKIGYRNVYISYESIA